MKNTGLCEVCGEEYINGHVECFMKIMNTKTGRRKLAEILEDVTGSAHCRAANNEERLMIFRACVRYGERLLRILRGQPEPKVN